MNLQQLNRIIIITRPVFWPLYPMLFLIGMNISGGRLDIAAWLEIIALSFPAALLTYGINDAYDIMTDEKNPRKKNIIEGTAISHDDAKVIKRIAPFAIFVLILSSFVSANPQNISTMALFAFSVYFYSAPPLRLKERPPFDSLANGFFYFLAPFLLGFSFGAPLAALEIRYAMLLTTCAVGLHALAAITDYDADKNARNKTIAILLGRQGAALFSFVLFLINLFFSWPLQIYLMLIIFALGALVDLITQKYAKLVMLITIMWGVVTTLTYFIEKVLMGL